MTRDYGKEQPSSLKVTDDQSRAVQKTPYRIALGYITTRIKDVEYLYPRNAPTMTLAIVYLDNEFILVGKSTPADPGNFDRELGKKFAYEDAIRQAWPLFAFALREGLTDNDVKSDLEEWDRPDV